MNVFVYPLPTISILTILYIILLIANKKKAFWSFIFCLGLAPFVDILLFAVDSSFNGIGLLNGGKGFGAALIVITMYIIFYWYIIIPAVALIIVSTLKLSAQNKKTQTTNTKKLHPR